MDTELHDWLPMPMNRWERLVDSYAIPHLLWSYYFTGNKIVKVYFKPKIVEKINRVTGRQKAAV